MFTFSLPCFTVNLATGLPKSSPTFWVVVLTWKGIHVNFPSRKKVFPILPTGHERTLNPCDFPLCVGSVSVSARLIPHVWSSFPSVFPTLHSVWFSKCFLFPWFLFFPSAFFLSFCHLSVFWSVFSKAWFLFQHFTFGNLFCYKLVSLELVIFMFFPKLNSIKIIITLKPGMALHRVHTTEIHLISFIKMRPLLPEI